MEERIRGHLEDRTDTLYICPNAWALRHRFVHKETGKVIRARCNCWRCEYCGPRKVDLWRQLIAEAQPTLHVVLTMVGKTVEQAARALTTWVQAMRRGSKGKGPNRVEARPAYALEYFAVLERHEDFEQVGFHWHILIVGVDYLPHEHIKACLLSATKHTTRQHTDVAACYVRRVQKGNAIGYVTKYLTKDIMREEKGVRVEEREMIVLGLDENGNTVERRRVVQVETVSHARRIRYSRGFFPEAVKELRAKLFAWERREGEAQEEETAGEEAQGSEPGESTQGKQPEEPGEPGEVSGTVWKLTEVAPFTSDREAYRWLRRQALEETLSERVASGRGLSWRIVSVWGYQRSRLREAG